MEAKVSVNAGWWGLKDPNGHIVYAEIRRKGGRGDFLSRCAKAIGKDSWRKCYRAGWRVLPALVMEAGASFWTTTATVKWAPDKEAELQGKE